jgi:streptomycin 6-kinase
MAEGIRLQPLTRSRVRSLGPAGEAWVRSLPEVIADLERAWSITVGRSLPGGSSSYVARATRADGSAAVVKIAVLADGLDDQVATLTRADGRGYVRLLDHDRERRALLLEPLSRALGGAALPPREQLRLLADTLALAWQDPGDRRPVPGRDKASLLGRYVATTWAALGRPCSRRVVDRALEYADQLVTVGQDDLVVVHGDPHPGNLLAVPTPRPGAESGYVFVDPDGFVADRGYDLGVAVRDWCGWLTGTSARGVAEDLVAGLAEHSGVAADRIWAWGFLERVSTGLYVTAFGADRLGATFLGTAELLV